MQVLEAATVARGAGEARWWFGSLAEIKATAAETGGQFTLVEITVSPNYQGVRHVHHNEDEAFWVLEGDMDLEIGGVHTHLEAGGYAFGPRDIPHGFSAGDAGCRVLFLLTPGGFEDLIMATSEPAPTRTVPPPSDEMPDIARLNQIVAQFGGEILV
ncbi:MAG TPA: cupin domain-containing protein [Candidatus Dormibacteraeota bacterium]|jgi:quercetin dioxygenase-like cupin family protein|nr:cupin domain-containing protein [Candidatus Dormibacteraeota bacterium]